MVRTKGLLIASPEYNSSISPLLKNAIDWASRLDGQEPPLAAFANKVAADHRRLAFAVKAFRRTARDCGTTRRDPLNIQVLVLPDQIAIVKAHEAYTSLTVRSKIKAASGRLEGLGRKLVEIS